MGGFLHLFELGLIKKSFPGHCHFELSSDSGYAGKTNILVEFVSRIFGGFLLTGPS